MSISERTDFDAWLEEQRARLGTFTLLLVLLGGDARVPLCATHLPIADAAPDWDELTTILTGAAQDWTHMAVAPARSAHGGLLDNPTARIRLAEFQRRLEPPSTAGDAIFFDSEGRLLGATGPGQP